MLEFKKRKFLENLECVAGDSRMEDFKLDSERFKVEAVVA